MRFMFFLAFCMLMAAPGFAFEAVVETRVETPSGLHTARWEVEGNQQNLHFRPSGQEKFSGQALAVPQGCIITFNGQERQLHGEVVFDENAEGPWNLLVPDFIGKKEIAVRIQAPGVDFGRAYTLECSVLHPDDLLNYEVEPEKDQEYRVVRVYRGQNVIAEQVWAVGEDMWLVDVNGEQRSVRVSYAP